MKKLLTVSLLILASTQAAQARSENVMIVKAPKAVIEDSSEANRIGKTVTVVGQLFGVGPSSTPSSGLALGFHLNRNTVILAEVMNNDMRYGFLSSNYDYKGRSYGLHIKQFVGNSFYARGGVDHRVMDHSYRRGDLLGLDSSYYATRRLEGSSTAASIAIGNQWQWSNFTLGCDWIGYVQPLASKVRESLSGSFDSADRESLEEDKKRHFTGGLTQGLRFYLGASF